MEKEFKLGQDIEIHKYGEEAFIYGLIIGNNSNNGSFYHGEEIESYKALGEDGEIYYGANDESYKNYDYCFKPKSKVKTLKK